MCTHRSSLFSSFLLSSCHRLSPLRGYFAVVKVGIDRATGEKVAIKLVNKSLVEKEETLANEIGILGSIDHPSVVNMRAIFDTEDILFIVMELCGTS